ncbi:MAG: response regulator [Actinomycetales bacterium]|nr:response regulator [Actinomycetales bacterium]
MARLVVVEDDGFTRMLLCSQLRELGHEVVGDAAASAEGIACVRALRPDALIVDLDLGRGPTGLDVAHAVRRMLPGLGILMLTSYIDVRLIGDFRPLPPGSVFMVKRTLNDPAVLSSAIDLSLASSTGPSTAPIAARSVALKLRDGQIEIMRLVAAGYTNAEIAKERHIEEKSVAKAVTRLLDQLDLKVTEQRNPRVLITQAYYAFIAGLAEFR